MTHSRRLLTCALGMALVACADLPQNQIEVRQMECAPVPKIPAALLPDPPTLDLVPMHLRPKSMQKTANGSPQTPP